MHFSKVGKDLLTAFENSNEIQEQDEHPAYQLRLISYFSNYMEPFSCSYSLMTLSLKQNYCQRAQKDISIAYIFL